MRSALPSAVRQDGAHLQPRPFLLLDFRPSVFATALNNLKAKRINALTDEEFLQLSKLVVIRGYENGRD